MPTDLSESSVMNLPPLPNLSDIRHDASDMRRGRGRELILHEVARIKVLGCSVDMQTTRQSKRAVRSLRNVSAEILKQFHPVAARSLKFPCSFEILKHKLLQILGRFDHFKSRSTNRFQA
ncbi:hypothetical protein NE237_019220 [Protea cynaroides]|uniref:Uncharacterized protein n=1 Tax=Protea cynaroides TaxID=273540 RepID=A0A9Q0KBK8_9MAGN|nr:hypothetical protein NE237_019220 [Protea cynaroides]